MGMALSCPILNMHVERHTSNYSRSATIHLNGWRPSQEDAHAIGDVNENISIYAIFDGHGGPLASEFCSANIAQALSHIVDITDTTSITQSLLQLDHTFMSNRHLDGCTACIVLAQPWDYQDDVPAPKLTKPWESTDDKRFALKLAAVNLGDSRAILFHPDGTWDQMTEDHKPQDQGERDRIIQAGGSVQNNRVDGQLALSRAIGDAQYKSNPRLDPTRQKVIAVPDIDFFRADYADVLFVACDGIFEATLQYYSESNNNFDMNYQNVTDLLINRMRAEQSSQLQQVGLAADPSHPDHKFVDYLWDPAVIARYIIGMSICRGSKDNHTAMVVSFTPFLPSLTSPTPEPTLESTPEDTAAISQSPAQLLYKKILNLPQHEIIPGATYDCTENSFLNAFRTDLLADRDLEEDEFEQLQDDINNINSFVHHHTHSGTNYLDDNCLLAFPDQDCILGDHYSLPPLALLYQIHGGSFG